MKKLQPGREHADPDTPGLYFLVSMDGIIRMIYRYTDGEYSYGEFLGTLDETSVQSARAKIRQLYRGTCPV